MLAPQQVSDIALRVIERHLPDSLERLSVSKIQNAAGDDAWHVQAVLDPVALRADRLNDRAEALTELQWRLGQADEPLFAYVTFTSDAELTEQMALAEE